MAAAAGAPQTTPVTEPSRRRRLVARLVAGSRDADAWSDAAEREEEEDGGDEVRVLPAEPAPFVEPAQAWQPAPVAPPAAPPTDFPLADVDPPALPRPVPGAAAAPAYRPAAANPGPLPDPLPPPLDAAVRGLREDLLAAGPDAAGLADEICARHRDRLRAVLAALAPPG